MLKRFRLNGNKFDGVYCVNIRDANSIDCVHKPPTIVSLSYPLFVRCCCFLFLPAGAIPAVSLGSFSNLLVVSIRSNSLSGRSRRTFGRVRACDCVS